MLLYIVGHLQVTHVSTSRTPVVCATINPLTNYAQRMKIFLYATHPSSTGTVVNLPSQRYSSRVVGVHNSKRKSNNGPKCRQQKHNSKWKSQRNGCKHVILILKFILPYLPVNIIIALNPTYAREIRRINHPNTQIWPLVVEPLADS